MPTLTFTAGISLLYKAANNWAHAEINFPDSLNPVPAPETRTAITQAKRRASLRYLISGCAFVTAGLINRYGPKILALFTRSAR